MRAYGPSGSFMRTRARKRCAAHASEPADRAAISRFVRCHAMLLGLLLTVATRLGAEVPAEFDAYPGDLRLRATFRGGDAVVDVGPGEQRLSRMWGEPSAERPPWQKHRDGLIALEDCMVPGPNAGRFAFETRTDAALRGLGALNARSGTVAFRIRRGAVFNEGGILLSGRSHVPGGPQGGVHWAMGIGGRGSRVPVGRLFLESGAVRAVSDTPLTGEGDWVHLAAVWDADMGVRLYVDGSRVGDSWRDPGDPVEAEERTVYAAAEGGADAVARWRVQCRGDDERGWVPVLQESPWDDVRIAWMSGDSVLRVETERETRLQFMLPPMHGLAPGAYRMVLRYRQWWNDGAADGATRTGLGARLTLQEEQDDRPIGASAATAMTAGPEARDGWQELSRVFVLGPHEKAGDAGRASPAPARFPRWPFLNAAWLHPGSETSSFTGRFDINLTGPGIFEWADLRLMTVDPAALAAEDRSPRLLHGYGRGMTDGLHAVVPVPVERIRIHRNGRGNALTDLHVFDTPLTGAEIARMARGDTREPGMEWAVEPVLPDRSRRFQVLGWGRDLDGDLPVIHPGRPVTVHEQWAERVLEDLRAAGSIAADGRLFTLSPWFYHGYTHTDPRVLRLGFASPPQANYLVARGDFSGEIRAGGPRSDPLEEEPLILLPGSPSVFRHTLPVPFRAQHASLVRRSGQVSGIHFYRIEHNGPVVDGGALYHLHGTGGVVPLDEWKRQEFVTAYPPADRGYIVGDPVAGARTETRRMAALRVHHFFSEAAEADLPVAGVALRLNLRGLAGPTRMQIRVHDAFDPWREWARMDVALEPGAGTESVYDVVLRLRETLLLAGHAAWVAVILDRDAELVYRPGGGESTLRLLEADPSVARRNFLEWELDGWRTAFESMSEPRPWGRGISDEEETGWWLRAASPEYEHMVRVGRMLLGRFPDDLRVASWFAFIHSLMPDPSVGVALPDAGSHPRWAVLARAALGRYAAFIDWWMDHRYDGRGQFGSSIGDDTDLLQEWPDLALIDDAGGRYRDAVQALATAVVEWPLLSPREFRGRPYVANGLNSRWTDGLHAYEDGVNMQPMDFLLDYGNPVRFHRLMQTAARYDGFLLTPAEDGERRFNSDGDGRAYWNTDRLPEGSPLDRDFFPATHAGQMLIWYNGSPKVADMFSELASWLIRSRAEGRQVRLERGGWYLMLALWRHFGDERYLGELIDLASVRESGVLRPPPSHLQPASALVRHLPEDLFDADRTLAASREDAAERFAPSAPLGTNRMAGDRRYETCWFEWVLSGNKDYLEEGLEALYRRLTFTLPAVTVAEQSGDRVAVPKQLVSLLYTGGVPVARNEQFFPMFAASYEGLGRNFAAIVLDDREDLLRVLFYSFEPARLRGLLRVWGMGPGTFAVSGGSDRTGDDRMDEVEHRFDVELVRGDGVEIEIPPQQLYVWEARRTRAGRPLRERPDLAVTGEDSEWGSDGSLTVRVHNIGSAPAPASVLELYDALGHRLAVRQLPPIEAPLDLRPRTVEVRFRADEVSAVRDTRALLEARVDAGHGVEEITRRNNRARIPVFLHP